MAYTQNPHLPRLRMEAAQFVLCEKWSTREVARHTGFNQSTIVRWVEEARHTNRRIIPTRSSRPHGHPDALPREIVSRILALRAERNQCAEILHWRLTQEGITVSLSSVKRVLKRCGLTRFSKWKKWHAYPERPEPENPGILVEIDTVHIGASSDKLYVYTLLDVCPRWAWAAPAVTVNTHHSLRFLKEAQGAAPFVFRTLQSDHGPEFSRWFTLRTGERGMEHRHPGSACPPTTGIWSGSTAPCSKNASGGFPDAWASGRRRYPSI